MLFLAINNLVNKRKLLCILLALSINSCAINSGRSDNYASQSTQVNISKNNDNSEEIKPEQNDTDVFESSVIMASMIWNFIQWNVRIHDLLGTDSADKTSEEDAGMNEKEVDELSATPSTEK